MCVIVKLNVINLSVVLVSVAARLASFSVTTNFLRFCDDAKKIGQIAFQFDSCMTPLQFPDWATPQWSNKCGPVNRFYHRVHLSLIIFQNWGRNEWQVQPFRRSLGFKSTTQSFKRLWNNFFLIFKLDRFSTVKVYYSVMKGFSLQKEWDIF
jgi:hypothetical protein